MFAFIIADTAQRDHAEVTGRVLVTGASGFVGSALVAALSRNGGAVRAAYRTVPQDLASSQDCIAVGELSASTNWMPALEDVEAVVHLAGPAHGRFTDAAMGEQITRATQALAAQAEAAGVRRFVYVSSIKAVCARTLGAPVREDDEALPEDAYGRAKLAAEATVMGRPALRPVVLRPPLVIAPNAKANVASLMRLVASGIPLPFGGFDNRRSLLSRASLVEAISDLCLEKEGPTGVFHIADRPAVSTSTLVEALSAGMGRRTIMFGGVGALLPRQLTESLEVDDMRLRTNIGDAWSRDARSAVFACGAAYKASTL